MGSPYTSVSVSGYNPNPPSDDGSQTEANRVKWATIKTKLSDPLNTYAAAQDAAITAAFLKVVGGNGITSTAISYQVLSTDQGKLVRASAGGITITTPDATNVDDPFVFAVVNDGASDITIDGSGSQTIDGSANITLGPTDGVQMFTDGTNWFAIGRTRRTQVPPQGYLTLIATATDAINVIPTTDQAGATAVYYRPTPEGNLLPISDGTNFTVKEFTELTLTLAAQHVADAIYDVFAFDDPGAAGTTRIGTGPAWSTSTPGSGARSTGAGTTELTLLKGLKVNAVAITARNGASTYSVPLKCATYLGTVYIDHTAGQTTCHVTYGQSRKWGIYNAYNQRDLHLKGGDPTASWAYTTTKTQQASNNVPTTYTAKAANVGGTTSNALTVLCGLLERVEIRLDQDIQASSGTTANGTSRGTVGIGINSVTTASGLVGQVAARTSAGGGQIENYGNAAAAFMMAPFIGLNEIFALEAVPNIGATAQQVLFNGAEVGCILSVTWRG